MSNSVSRGRWGQVISGSPHQIESGLISPDQSITAIYTDNRWQMKSNIDHVILPGAKTTEKLSDQPWEEGEEKENRTLNLTIHPKTDLGFKSEVTV